MELDFLKLIFVFFIISISFNTLHYHVINFIDITFKLNITHTNKFTLKKICKQEKKIKSESYKTIVINIYKISFVILFITFAFIFNRKIKINTIHIASRLFWISIQINIMFYLINLLFHDTIKKKSFKFNFSLKASYI